MRDLMVLGAMFFLIPMAWRSPFAAYLLWGWTAMITLDSYVFGFMSGMRFNLLFALLALFMLLANSGKLEARLSINRTTVLLLLWLLQGSLSAIFAYPGVPRNWELYENLVKILLFVMLMPLVVNGRYRIHAMVVVLCLGIGFHGLIDGLKVFVSGGGHIVRGLGKFGDNNHFAVIILLIVPLLLYLYRHSAHWLVRWTALGAATLTLAAVVGTRSRGGLLAMAAGGIRLIQMSRRKVLGLSIVAGLAVLVVSFAPSDWLRRMDTMKAADEDSSFMARVGAWQASSALALNNPFLGGGFHAVEHQPVWERFRAEQGLLVFVPEPANPSLRARAAHSIYFETMGDLGLVGFGLFLAILLNILITAAETRRQARLQGPSMVWAFDLAGAFSVFTVIFMVGGAGVSIAYQESLYVAAMLTEILKQHVLAQAAKYRVSAQAVVSRS